MLRLVSALPANVQGRAIGGQLMRAGTSVGANYRAACRGRSRREFIAKIGVVEEEADESAFWMELIIEGEMLKGKTCLTFTQRGPGIGRNNGEVQDISNKIASAKH